MTLTVTSSLWWHSIINTVFGVLLLFFFFLLWSSLSSVLLQSNRAIYRDSPVRNTWTCTSDLKVSCTQHSHWHQAKQFYFNQHNLPVSDQPFTGFTAEDDYISFCIVWHVHNTVLFSTCHADTLCVYSQNSEHITNCSHKLHFQRHGAHDQ